MYIYITESWWKELSGSKLNFYTPVKQTFVRGDGGANYCPSNGKPTLTERECKLAAIQFHGYYKQAVSWSTKPRGCFIYREGSEVGNVYWNTHPDGFAQDAAEPLCVERGLYIL